MDQKNLVLLQAFFASATLPDLIALGPGETISDLPRFLASHFMALKASCPAAIRDSYSARLIKLRGLL